MNKKVDRCLIADYEVIEIMADYKKVIEVLSVCLVVYFHGTGDIDDKMSKVLVKVAIGIASKHNKTTKIVLEDILDATRAIYINKFITVH